jgi:hypothetical protein
MARRSFLVRLILLAPGRIEKNLAQVAASRGGEDLPNLWQLSLGVLRMHHRVLFRFDTIGTCGDHPVRDSWRARRLHFRPLRFFFLMAERAIAPWDYTGLVSSPERLQRHLLGAHHDGQQFVYDLQILSCYPGRLEAVRAACQRIVDGSDPRATWLRDLTVHESYHEVLLEALDGALAGRDTLTPEEHADPDLTFWAFLKWCAAQPATPLATWRAWRAGRYAIASGMENITC